MELASIQINIYKVFKVIVYDNIKNNIKLTLSLKTNYIFRY